MRFDDRRTAGEALGRAVAAESPPRPLVAALPRGGVPVGFEVASALGCALDVLLVRKIGVPFHPELAMGAVGEGHVVIRNRDVIASMGISDEEFAATLRHQRVLLDDRLRVYRSASSALDPEGMTVVIVDDGMATGSTVLAGVAAAKARGAAAVWVAVPVAPLEAVESVEADADRVVVLQVPRRFMAVGAWYRDFAQTTDAEVLELLARSRG